MLAHQPICGSTPVDIIDSLIETPRGSFQVRQQGSAGSPVVVALHGFPDIAATFDGVGAALAAEGFHFIAPQARGYAPSAMNIPKKRILFDELALDALAVLDALAPGRRFCVLGHDNGAFATYSLLRLAGTRAIAAVTLTAAHPASVFKNSGKLPRQMWRSRYAMFFQLPGLSEWWAARNDFAYLEQLWRDWAHPGWRLPSAHLAAVKKTMAASWPAPLLHYRAMPFSGDETVLTQPVLYLIGDQDGCVMPEAGAGQERLFSGAFQSEIIAGAGHFLHLESPGVVTPKIVAWFKDTAR